MKLTGTALILLVLSLAPAPAKAEFDVARFPIEIAPKERYLQDADGNPFLVHGDAAWSLIAELTREEAELYLSDRKARGFNTILVSLIERKFATNAPANAYGQAPFVVAGDFSNPNDLYFDHAEWVLRRAHEMGFLVLLAPAYLGFGGGDQGWYGTMEAAGTEKLRAYGRYIGERFGDLPNILWLHGGDHDAANKDLVRAVVRGLEEVGTGGLATVHSAPDTLTLRYWQGDDWLDLDTVYTYSDVYSRVIERYRETDKPVLMLESAYEGEHEAGEQVVRSAAYSAILAGAVGHVFGNNPIWHFSGPGIYSSEITWQDALDSPGAQSMTHFRRLFSELPWWELEPVTSSRLLEATGSSARIISAAIRDGSLLVAYVKGASHVIFDRAFFGESGVEAEWFDPSTGWKRRESPGGEPSTSLVMEPPAPRNGTGGDDWVLILRTT